MRRQNAEYKMNIIILLAKLYQTQQELVKVYLVWDRLYTHPRVAVSVLRFKNSQQNLYLT